MFSFSKSFGKIKAIQDQGKRQKHHIKQLVNTNASVHKKDNFFFSKEKERFKKLYSERVNKINELRLKN